LNEYEKYTFLLQSYWTSYPFEEKFDCWINIKALYDTLVAIVKSEDGEISENDKSNSLHRMYSQGADFFHHLSFFGFGDLKLIEGANGKYKDSINKFSPNPFGIETSEFLLIKALLYWNIDDYTLNSGSKGMKLLPKENRHPFKAFKNIFQDKLVINTVKTNIKIDRTGVYSFKVSLSKTVWRKINLSYKHTLANLHKVIQEAFSFDDDHLYAFYLGGNKRNRKPIYCEFADSDGVTTEETRIADLELYVGQKMLYLFDFGDDWEFEVELMGIDKAAPLLSSLTQLRNPIH